MNRIRCFWSMCFLLGSLSSFAQLTFKRDMSVPVIISGETLPYAWAGGLNFTQFSSIDINLDGNKDLVVFDRSGNHLLPFIHLGGNDTINYEYQPDLAGNFPPLHDWALFADYNNDNKEDIFTYSNGGFSVYKNTSSATQLSFKLEKYLVYSQYGSNYVNLWISAVDIPAITDVDNDGDIDILTFGLAGATVEYHQNMSMENYGIPDSLDFVLNTSCWGQFSENFSSNSVLLNATCKGGDTSPDLSETGELHSGSTLLAIDGDDDGDKELILGDISFANLVYLNNGGDSSNAVMISQDSLFPIYDTPANLEIFPASFYVDIDHDGKRDLIIGTNSQNAAENFQSVHYYKNTNTDLAPVFSFRKNSVIQEDMIDLGEGAYPVFFDYNADGLQDLIVGNYAYYGPAGNYKSQLALFENTGTATSPVFTLITRDYLNIASLNLYGAVPAFGDMDDDGDDDMLLGDYNGYVHLFKNAAGPGNPASFSLTQANYESIDPGQFATPQIIDVDRNGVPDILLGERNGNLNYYPNLGTATQAQFKLDVKEILWQSGITVRYMFNGSADLSRVGIGEKLNAFGCTEAPNNGTFVITDVNPGAMYIEVTNSLRPDATYDEAADTPGEAIPHDDFFGNVDSRQFGYFTGYSVPFMYDNNGSYNLLVGSETGYIFRYDNIDGNLDGAFTETDTTYMQIREGQRSSVNGTDINGDGVIDLVMGNYRGGLGLFTGSKFFGTIDPNMSESQVHIFPNPATNTIHISCPGLMAGMHYRYQVHDMLGRLVQDGTIASHDPTIDVQAYGSGTYLLTLYLEDMIGHARFIVSADGR
ncbi:MAG: T9SS type A sorting domain-containing protein [Flavobacteriales bacterium]|nr:T9SS type A sorting domain-containing protein [Flavobacteriales bacterium]